MTEAPLNQDPVTVGMNASQAGSLETFLEGIVEENPVNWTK